MKGRYWMRMDGRNPSRVLHYNFLEDEQVFKRKDSNLWIPIFKEWYHKDGTPLTKEEIWEVKRKNLDKLFEKSAHCLKQKSDTQKGHK